MNDNSKTLYLLDGYSLIYRSYFAFINRPLLNSRGFNTSAVFGFFRTLTALFERYNPELFAVVLDSVTPTFRHQMYPEYKANREKAPDDLHAQVPVISEVLDALKIKTVRVDGYEADDIMAYFAVKCTGEKRPCCIITGDKDLLQLVNPYVSIMRPEKGDYQLMSEDSVEEVWGVKPEQIIDYLALTGDSADNVPGVRGIGPKTAVKLLGDYGSLEGIYEALDQIAAGSRKKLEESKENAFLSRKLVTLVTDFGLDTSPAELSADNLDRSAAAAVLRREEVNSVADRLEGKEQRESAGSGGNGSGAAKKSAVKAAGDTPVFTGISDLGTRHGVGSADGSYEAVTDESRLIEWVAKVRESGIFAFDSETTDIDPMKAEPLGFSLSCSEGEACYIPLRAADESGEIREWMNPDRVRNALAGLLEDSSLKCVGQNIKYDYKVMKRWGIEIKNIFFDTMIAAWVLDSSLGSYNMDLLAERSLGYKTIHYKDIVEKGSLFDSVKLETAARYAAEDADITLRLFHAFRPELEERKLLGLYEEIELPLIRVLAEMEIAGIRLDREQIENFSGQLGSELEQIQQQIYRLCGEEFNINSTKQLQEILFEKRGLKPVKKTKTGYSTNVQALEILADQDPVPEKILEHRSLAKLKSTYADTLPALINAESGRIHTDFIQTGTATGRIASRDPNLQNIPVKTSQRPQDKGGLRSR